MNKNLKLWVISGAFGGLLFAINFSLGALITYATGMPGASGIVTGLTTGFVFYILMRMTKTFGAIGIAFTLYCLLATPTVLMGPPGPYKILIGLCCGLSFDVILYFLRYKTISYFIGFLTYVSVLSLGIYLAYTLFNLADFNKVKNAMFIFLGIFTLEGWIAGWFARKLFENRLKKLSVVKRVSITEIEE